MARGFLGDGGRSVVHSREGGGVEGLPPVTGQEKIGLFFKCHLMG